MDKFRAGDRVFCKHLNIKAKVIFVHNLYTPMLYTCMGDNKKRYAFKEEEIQHETENRG